MINAFVYKEGDDKILVPLATEKKIILVEDLEISDNRDIPLSNYSIAMCWYDEVGSNKYKIKPAVIVDLTFNGKKIPAARIRFDDLVSAAYQAAIEYTNRKKLKESLEKEILS